MAKAKRKRVDRKTTSHRPQPDSATPLNPSACHRIASFDALRGLAIALMIVDHIAGMLFTVNIEWNSIRMLTRLSMPLFAVLMGYFLRPDRPLPKQRLGWVALACGLVSLSYIPMYREFEILGSLLVANALFYITGRRFVFLVSAILIAPWDPSAMYFDYPLGIVTAFVATGFLYRQRGIGAAMLASLLCVVMTYWIPPPTAYVIYFLPIAVLLMELATRFGHLTLPGLNWLGRHPLIAYVAQHYCVLAVAGMLGKLN